MREEVYTDPLAARSPAFLLRRVSWGAIFAGVIVTIIVQLMFTVLGIAIGASTIDPAQERNPTEGLALGSAIWLLATGLISVFLGTFVAGRLSGGPRRPDGMLHGVVTWSVFTLVTLFVLASATGMVVGGLGSLIGGTLRTASESGIMQDPELQQQVKSAMSETGASLPPTGNTPGAQASSSGSQGSPGSLAELAKNDPQLAAAIARMEAQGGPSQAEPQRQEVISILTGKHGMEQQQASTLVAQWGEQSQQIRAKARETGQVAAEKTAQGAWWAFAALVLGLGVAAWGGWVGTASLPPRVEPVRVAAAKPVA